MDKENTASIPSMQHSIIPGQNAYLLLHLFTSCDYILPHHVVIEDLADSGQSMEIYFWSKHFIDDPSKHRIVFWFNDQRRDNENATLIAEGILLLVEVFGGPAFDLRDSHVAYPFIVPKDMHMSNLDMSDDAYSVKSLFDDSMSMLTECMMGTGVYLGDRYVSVALKTLPILLQDKQVALAASFLSVAQHDFYVCRGRHKESIDEGDWKPSRLSEMAYWESAFQNAYKAVEALIGDPPKCNDKFKAKLLAEGLDPDELGGYTEKRRLADVIRNMNDIRDKRAAHGATRTRGITLCEMIEYQQCARYVVQHAIQRRYGSTLF